MLSFGFAVWLLFLSAPDAPTPNRVERFAALKAHRILPASLRELVKQHASDLFEGLSQALSQPSGEINEERVLQEAEKITLLVNKQAPFKEVVRQMGFVSGLVALQIQPARGGSTTIRDGTAYYANLKLNKFFFVFDGYREPSTPLSWLNEELRAISLRNKEQRAVLQKQYDRVGGNTKFAFDERSPVFGVCSIYFSNLARLTAHLWYHAWALANGDLTRTPYLKKSLPHH